jgi:hypothetical protein
MPETRGRARLWTAPLLLLGVAVASCAVYDRAPPAVANFAILPYATCLVLAPALLYPWLRRRGAGKGTAAAGSLVMLAAWLAKELWQVSAAFPPLDSLFYALNPVCLGLLVAALLQMALAELVLRWRRGAPARGPALLAAAILLLASGVGLAARGSGGREIFYAYVALYARLFGG